MRPPGTRYSPSRSHRNLPRPPRSLHRRHRRPPCQDFSRARRRPPTGHGIAMLKQFTRLITQTNPHWWLLENVPGVPDIHISPYKTQRFNLMAKHFGLHQIRNRSFQFASKDGIPLLILRHTQSHLQLVKPAVTASDRTRPLSELLRLQGLPPSFKLPGLSRAAKTRAIGNGVPVPVAHAIACAIRDRSVTTKRLCICECGRELTGRPNQKTATPACRKRLERKRKRKEKTK